MFKQILKKIEQYDVIIIHRHVNPDPDALGSQLGLAKAIQVNYPNKTVYAVGEMSNSLSYLGNMDEIIEKDYHNSLVIVLDTANTDRIDGKFYIHGRELIKIDHHPNHEPYGTICYVDTTASSTSEIIVSFIRENQLVMTDDIARLLYAGIVGDTGRFLFSNATQQTMLIAAYLREFNFSAVDINRQMIAIDFKTAKFNGYALQNFVLLKHGVGYFVITKALMDTYALSYDDTNAVVGLFGNIEEVKCWVVFVEKEDGTYRARIRSKTVVINTVAEQFDGGGHPFASGANAKNVSEINLLVEKLEEVASK